MTTKYAVVDLYRGTVPLVCICKYMHVRFLSCLVSHIHEGSVLGFATRLEEPVSAINLKNHRDSYLEWQHRGGRHTRAARDWKPKFLRHHKHPQQLNQCSGASIYPHLLDSYISSYSSLLGTMVKSVGGPINRTIMVDIPPTIWEQHRLSKRKARVTVSVQCTTCQNPTPFFFRKPAGRQGRDFPGFSPVSSGGLVVVRQNKSWEELKHIETAFAGKGEMQTTG